MTDTATEEALVQETLALLSSIQTGEWLQPDLAARARLTAPDTTMRPIDDLDREGLHWLRPYVGTAATGAGHDDRQFRRDPGLSPTPGNGHRPKWRTFAVSSNAKA
jgi:hypothetical protein